MRTLAMMERSFEVEFTQTPEGFWLATSGKWQGVGETKQEAVERLHRNWVDWCERATSAAERLLTVMPRLGGEALVRGLRRA